MEQISKYFFNGIKFKICFKDHLFLSLVLNYFLLKCFICIYKQCIWINERESQKARSTGNSVHIGRRQKKNREWTQVFSKSKQFLRLIRRAMPNSFINCVHKRKRISKVGYRHLSVTPPSTIRKHTDIMKYDTTKAFKYIRSAIEIPLLVLRWSYFILSNSGETRLSIPGFLIVLP